MHALSFGNSTMSLPTVLIAEDDNVARTILQHWLTSWGFDVITAIDGNAAWEILQSPTPPKLILMDWVMPGIDGVELCRRLREQSRSYYQYILMATGRSDMDHIVHALESGADDCITKPFEGPELKARITVACRILALQDELIQAREEIRKQAMKDSLTGLWTRPAFTELFEFELGLATRSHNEIGLLLLDLDHFKQINDTYGHLVGDAVLRKAARILRHNVRNYDFVGRYGGEEFFVAFPNCDEQILRQQAERIRIAVASQPLHIGTNEISISISIGAAITTANGRTLSDLLSVADVALYHAKDVGRNRSVFCNRAAQEMQAEAEPGKLCAACPGASACLTPQISPQA